MKRIYYQTPAEHTEGDASKCVLFGTRREAIQFAKANELSCVEKVTVTKDAVIRLANEQGAYIESGEVIWENKPVIKRREIQINER